MLGGEDMRSGKQKAGQQSAGVEAKETDMKEPLHRGGDGRIRAVPSLSSRLPTPISNLPDRGRVCNPRRAGRQEGVLADLSSRRQAKGMRAGTQRICSQR